MSPSFIAASSCLFLAAICASHLAHSASGDHAAYKTDYFTVPVDHFSYTNNDTFRMKYLINDTYWKPKTGPIFFYAGNEGAIETFCENTGFMWDIAEEFGALLVFAEHRYYGESMPYGAKSYDDKQRLGYLTSEQALADYADLLTYLKHKGLGTRKQLNEAVNIYNDTSIMDGIESGSNLVVAFGGSYGGMLAAWFRMKYPAIVEGAIASSAPIWQFTGMTPCNAFYRVTSSVYMDTSTECGLTIRASWGAINNVTKTADGKSWLSRKWKMCSQLTNDDDVSKLKDWVAGLYVNLAMINYPYPANFLMPLPGNPVKELCKSLRNHKEDDFTLLSSVFTGLNVYFNYTGSSKCLDISSSSAPTLGDQGWNFQSCTEMVMPMCSNGIKDIFEKSPWNFTEVDENCFKTYGVHPSVDFIKKTYGGKNLNAASNIIFSNGLLDPWSSGGVLQNISRTVRAVIIPESAHHLDLRASNVKDPESVVKARKFYKNWIKKWISHYQKHSSRDPIDTFVRQQEIYNSMTNHKENYYTLLSSVFNGLNVYFNYTGSSKCLDIFSLSAPTLGDQGWNFQSCTEMIMPICSYGINDIFEKSPWNFTKVDEDCFKTYGVYLSVDIIEKTYGGKNLKAVSNIIFSNGLLDPWSSGGLLQNISRTVHAVIMSDAAHHLDFRASNVKDPKSVVKARELYKYWFKYWIKNYQKPSLCNK